MTVPAFAIRPEPGLQATLAAARALGLTIHGEALFAIQPVPWTAPDGPIDGLLIGSANALRHGGEALAQWRHLPAYVVGEATAEAARQARFSVAAVGEGRLQPVLDRLQGEGMTLLRLTGVEHVPLDPPAGIRLVTRVVYDNLLLPMSDALAAQLREGGVVLLHSAAAARHMAAECDRLGIARNRLGLAVLSHRIAAAAGEGWRACRVAATPCEADLLALAKDMCH